MGSLKLVYEDDLVTLYHGDCRDVLEELPSQGVDLFLSDPPYGQQFAGQGVTTQKANIRADGARQGVRVFRQALAAVAPLLKPDAHFLSFCHWESWPDFYDAVSPYLPIKNALIWHKDRGGMGDCEMEYARDYEIVLYAASGRRPIVGKREGAVIKGIPPVGNDRRHPTEKPVALMRKLIIKHAPPGGLVIDPFAGVGSTLQAARELGVRAIGIEIERRWCEVAARDLAQGYLPISIAPPDALPAPVSLSFDDEARGSS